MSETLQAPDPLMDNLKQHPELIQDPDYQVALDARGRQDVTPASEASAARNMESDWRHAMLDAKDAEAHPSEENKADSEE